MTSRTLYGPIRPGSPSVPATQRDRRKQHVLGVGHGQDSKAKVDTVAIRLARLGVIIDEHDWQKLREWRVSQMMALGLVREDE